MAAFLCVPPLYSQVLDQIGVSVLRAMTTNLDGRGIAVAQPEASVATDAWQVNPATVGQSVARFSYRSAAGLTNGFPNALGVDSWHADAVGDNLYGMSGGVATNPARVVNYEVEYYYTNYIVRQVAADGEAVVNQSFTFGNVSAIEPTPQGYLSVGQQQMLDSQYDNYAASYTTLFVSAVNNSGSVSPPGTSYNGIGVGAYGGTSSMGPTVDNGRCKPDLCAPASATSYSTPYVAGAVAGGQRRALI